MITDTIKNIIENYLNYANLSDVVFGKVVSSSPMKVRLDVSSGLEIESPFLVVTHRMKEQPPSIGDKVVLIKALGGQSYVLLDKI